MQEKCKKKKKEIEYQRVYVSFHLYYCLLLTVAGQGKNTTVDVEVLKTLIGYTWHCRVKKKSCCADVMLPPARSSFIK